MELVPQTTTDATKPKWEYEGKGWQDPIAQQVAKKYMFSPFMTKFAERYNAGPDPGNKQFNSFMSKAKMDQTSLDAGKRTGYVNPLDPKNWVSGGVWQQRGGKPTLGANKTPYSFDADLARKEYLELGGKGLPEEFYPEEQKAKIAADKAAATKTAEGSAYTLAPDVLNKMWR